MALGSNNPFPSVLFTETAAASVSTPSSGQQRVFIDTADHLAKRKNSSGTVTTIGGGDVTGPASAVDLRIAVFDGTTGKLIKDGGTTIAGITAGAGKTAQTVNTIVSATATGTTTIPFDDTIPQNTEGTEFMTLSITPTSSSNKLLIEVVLFITSSAAVHVIAALFQDSTANALAAVSHYVDSATGTVTIPLTYYMTAGTTSATTFKVRAGGHSAATVRVNGQSGVGRLFGGVAASSMTITEIVP